MTANLSFNPFIQTVAEGSFNVQSMGYIQGMAMPDPSARYRLRGGVLASTETIPMWGGVAISETTSPFTGGAAGGETGGNITRATNATSSGTAGSITGFSVFDQDYAMVNSPQSPVPMAGSGQLVNFYPLGSMARIAVACDSVLASALEDQIITTPVAWDYDAQMLIPVISTKTISSGTYNNTTGEIVLTMSAPITEFGAGPAATLSSLTGTGAFASLDGTWIMTGVSGSTITLQGPVGVGASTITAGSLDLDSAAPIPVTVLNINSGNSMTVEYDSATGFATWNRSGTVAIIQLTGQL